MILIAKVVKGKQLGLALGFPPANLPLPQNLLKELEKWSFC